LRYLAEIFDDWLTRAAGIVLVLIIAVVIFNIYSPLPEKYPLFGVFTHSLAVLLFIAGGIIFVRAIMKSEFGGKPGEGSPQ